VGTGDNAHMYRFDFNGGARFTRRVPR
jgi:hypothetical protein